MTVGQLIAKLAALPEDMEVQVITEYRQDPVDIVTLARGSWSDDLSDDEDIPDDWDPEEEPEFVQDHEGGKVAVIVTW